MNDNNKKVKIHVIITNDKNGCQGRARKAIQSRVKRAIFQSVRKGQRIKFSFLATVYERGQYDPIEQKPRAFHWKNLVNIDGGLAYLHSGIRNGALFLRLEDMAACFVELSYEDMN